MKPIVRNIMAATGVLVLAGCVLDRAKVKSGYDFSKVRRMTVMPFEGVGGQAAADEFVRELVGAGLEVTDAQHPGDLLLKGTVTNYKADNAVIVFLGKTSLVTSGGQAIESENPVISVSSSQGLPEAAVVGTPKSQVTSVTSSVAVDARLIDAKTGSTVWAGNYAYEAMDIKEALQTVVGYLTGSFEGLLPIAHKPLS